MRVTRWGMSMIFLLLALSGLAGCSKMTAQEPGEISSSAQEEESSLAETAQETQEPASSQADLGNKEETSADERETDPEDPDTFVQQKIVIATDLHYLAEELSGNRGQAFIEMTEKEDGRVLHYSWEVLDAFIDDMRREKPDLLVLSGDLTLDGEKKSHEELVECLEPLLDEGIQIAVIPGNHDINNHNARRYKGSETEPVESVTAEEFRQIYADFGYIAADSRDPASLSYLYKVDPYYWLLLIDSCQYDPRNLNGGAIGLETYRWMEEVLEESWEQGAQVIAVSHHNLLDQSGVSQVFYDDCTIEHNEELIRRLSDYDVRLHLSGHLHLQHYMQDEDSEIYEIVTGSLVMAPCRYGVLKIWNDGTYQYDAQTVDVDGWAKRNSYRNPDLANFKEYSEAFLTRIAYQNATRDIRKHVLSRGLPFGDQKIDEMARFYAKLCVYYYGGRMFEIWDEVKTEDAYEDWLEIDYISELSYFLNNILQDEPEDFAHLKIPY